MIERLMFDTNVVIDLLRGHPKAGLYFDDLAGPLMISSITLAELYAGVREGRERVALEAISLEFRIVPVDEEIARIGGLFRRDYMKSHNIDLDDALIAATTLREGATLVTLNRKHFPMIPNLIVPYAKP